MHTLTEKIMTATTNAFYQYGQQELQNHFDLLVMDEWLRIYKKTKANEIIVSLNEILSVGQQFEFVMKDFHITIVETVLNALMELEYEEADLLQNDPILNLYIYVKKS